MRKLLTGVATALAAGSLASAAIACDWHNVTASHKTEQKIAMSTFDGAVARPVSSGAKVAETAIATPCAEGDKGCAPASK